MPSARRSFAAWFTGFGKLEGINYVDDVRIINPSAGLKQWYDQRARMLQQLIEEIRKAKGQPAATKAATKPAEARRQTAEDAVEDRNAQEAVTRRGPDSRATLVQAGLRLALGVRDRDGPGPEASLTPHAGTPEPHS